MNSLRFWIFICMVGCEAFKTPPGAYDSPQSDTGADEADSDTDSDAE